MSIKGLLVAIWMSLLTESKTITITFLGGWKISLVLKLPEEGDFGFFMAPHFCASQSCVDADTLDKNSSFYGRLHVKCHFPYDNLKIVYSQTLEIESVI